MLFFLLSLCDTITAAALAALDLAREYVNTLARFDGPVIIATFQVMVMVVVFTEVPDCRALGLRLTQAVKVLLGRLAAVRRRW